MDRGLVYNTHLAAPSMFFLRGIVNGTRLLVCTRWWQRVDPETTKNWRLVLASQHPPLHHPTHRRSTPFPLWAAMKNPQILTSILWCAATVSVNSPFDVEATSLPPPCTARISSAFLHHHRCSRRVEFPFSNDRMLVCDSSSTVKNKKCYFRLCASTHN
jgi:hypothetical protein